MLVPLVILALLSICGGWAGGERFDKFLSPVLHAGVTAYSPEEVAAATPVSEQKEHGASEGLLESISVLAAASGLFLAWLFYQKRPQLPQEMAHALGGFYEAVVHKYYVDEIYAAVFVKPLIDGSTRILWHGIDRDVIDRDAGQQRRGGTRSFRRRAPYAVG